MPTYNERLNYFISAKETNKMTEPVRISIEDARQKVNSGAALLVCAYDDDEKFKNNHLQGAISFGEFKAKLPSLSETQEIIFYCAWDKEASAAGQAEKLLKDGYQNAVALGGGVEAWKNAGYPLAE